MLSTDAAIYFVKITVRFVSRFNFFVQKREGMASWWLGKGERVRGCRESFKS